MVKVKNNLIKTGLKIFQHKDNVISSSSKCE